MSVISKFNEFTEGLSREDFYSFYAAVCSMSGPSQDNILLMDGRLLNIKHIVRRIRITLMWPRFRVDYAAPYSPEEASQEAEKLQKLLPQIQRSDLDLVAKYVKALQVISRLLTD